MGFLMNMIIAQLVHRGDQHRHHVARHLFGSIPEDGNVIVCGGEEDPSHLAAAIRRDVIFNRIDLAAKNKTPTLFLCSDQKLIGEVQEEWAQNDQVLVFGRNLPYAPFSCNVNVEDVRYLFDGILKRFGSSELVSVRGIIDALLTILSSSLPGNFFTWDNLDRLANELVYSQDGRLRNFLRFVEQETGQAVCGTVVNSLTLCWNAGLSMFQSFWIRYKAQMKQLAGGNGEKQSLFTSLCQGKICVFYVPSMNSDLLLESLLRELSIFRRNFGNNDLLIDYEVSLAGADENRIREDGEFLFVSRKLTSLGIPAGVMRHPVYICLGVDSADAAAILEGAVFAGYLRKPTVTIGGHARGVAIAGADGKIIQPLDLSLANIRDGGGCIIGPQGFTKVDNLFS